MDKSDSHDGNNLPDDLLKHTINPDPRVSKVINDHFWDMDSHAPADKPASLRAILDKLVKDYMRYYPGELYHQDIPKAIAAIERLVPEKRPTMRKAIDRSPLTNQDIKRDGFNEAIDEIHRNFNRQPQGDKEE